MTMKRSATILMFLFAVAALANLPVDYSVYFDPQPKVTGGAQVATTPIRTTVNGKTYERVYGIMYDVGETHGTHAYKYTLRASGPGGPACETSTLVQPFGPKNSSRRIAYFEAVYPGGLSLIPLPKTPPPQLYTLVVDATERVPSGEAAQDTSTGNNTYPNGACCKLIVAVRANVEAVHCGVVPRVPF